MVMKLLLISTFSKMIILKKMIIEKGDWLTFFQENTIKHLFLIVLNKDIIKYCNDDNVNKK